MSNSTVLPTALPQAPPGTIYVAEIPPALNFMLIGATLGSTLVTMLIALLFFSTPALRRKPVFILNLLALLLGIAGSFVNVYDEVHTLCFPDNPVTHGTVLALGAINSGFTPTLVDAILLLRLYAIYPYGRTPRAQFLVIIGVPILTKIGRIANSIIYLTDYAQAIRVTDGVGGAAGLLTSRLPSVKVEWSLQVFDDVWASVLFLIPVYKQSLFERRTSLLHTIQTLFWISASNFVFPLILGVVQLAVYVSNPDNYVLAVYIEEVNFSFTIVGVVFATLWAAKGQWDSLQNQSRPGGRRSDVGTHESRSLQFGALTMDVSLPGPTSSLSTAFGSMEGGRKGESSSQPSEELELEDGKRRGFLL